MKEKITLIYYSVKTAQIFTINLWLIVGSILTLTNTQAQLIGWQYKDAIKLENPSSQKINYQVLLNINTEELITAGKMQSSGADIRFSKDCNGSNLYPYWIESGINTANTLIWVKIDTLSPSGSRIINMHYGNNTATANTNFNNTFPLSRIVTAVELVSDTVWNYDWVEIESGAAVNLSPSSDSFPRSLSINSRKIKINGTLNGDSQGFKGGVGGGNGGGPGGGKAATSTFTSGGGGGYGGIGGNGATTANVGPGGIMYGTSSSIADIHAGSGGGAGGIGGAGNLGGNGGSLFILNATSVDILGTITSQGGMGASGGSYNGGAGGSGGGILIMAYDVNFNGIIAVKGGTGAGVLNGGGGGAGGRIKIFYENILINGGITDITGGMAGANGAGGGIPGNSGTFYTGTFVSEVPEYTIMPLPNISTSNTPVCPGENISFTADSGFVSYDFHINGNAVQNSTSRFFSSNTLNNGDMVNVLASNSSGCVFISNTITITNIQSTLPANAGPDTSVCAGGSITLNASGGTTYSWNPTTGLSCSNCPNPVANPSLTTIYKVTVSSGSCPPAADSVKITVKALPVVSAGNNAMICIGDSIQLSASGGVAYTWTPINGLDNPNIPDPIAKPGNSITYTVTATNAEGCVRSSSVAVTVNPLPIADAGDDEIMCPGASVILTASGGVDYTWDPPASLSCTNCSSTTASPATTTTYTVTVTDANGCSNKDSVVVNVTSMLITNAGPDTSVCAGESIVLNASGGTNYSWSPATGLSCNNCPNPVASPLYTTVYVVTLSSGSCDPATDSVKVTVKALPSASAGNNVMICTGDSVQLDAGGGISYSWSPATGLNNPDIADPMAGPATTTTYTVIVTDSNGCAATDDITVTVELCTGITKAPGDINMLLFPNPAGDVLYLQFNHTSLKDLSIEVVNIHGKLVYIEKVGDTSDNFSKQINISAFAKGIYYLRVIGADFFSVRKLIIQ